MKKLKNYVLSILFILSAFSAKAQFQSIQLVSSIEYVTFSSSIDHEQGVTNFVTPKLSNRFGVDAQWGLTSKISLRTGLRFSTINQFRRNIFWCGVGVTEAMQNEGHIYRDRNIEVPLGIRYNFKTKNKFQNYLEPFGSAVFDFNGNIFPEIGLAYGLEYVVNQRIGIFAQPTYRHTFNDKSWWEKQARNNYSLALGIRLKRK